MSRSDTSSQIPGFSPALGQGFGGRSSGGPQSVGPGPGSATSQPCVFSTCLHLPVPHFPFGAGINKEDLLHKALTASEESAYEVPL